MASFLLDDDNIGKVVNINKDGLSSKRKSKKRQSSSLKLNNKEPEKQEISKEEYYTVRSAIMSSDEEDITDDELIESEEKLKHFEYFKIFKIPLMLFILSFISVLFVNIFGKEYVRIDKTGGIHMIDPNYGSYIWNFSGKFAKNKNEIISQLCYFLADSIILKIMYNGKN